MGCWKFLVGCNVAIPDRPAVNYDTLSGNYQTAHRVIFFSKYVHQAVKLRFVEALGKNWRERKPYK